MKEKVLHNKQQKLENLTKSALELFMTKGIQDTSILDITSKAGVAKGTFYLYFHDKYSIRDHLVSKSAQKLFHNAHMAILEESGLETFEDKFLFITNHIIKELEHNRPLLAFISKNLSWGLFRHLAEESIQEDSMSGLAMFRKMADDCGVVLKNADAMVFLIIEMTSSSVYSVLYENDSFTMEQLLPSLNEAIRNIIKGHIVKRVSPNTLSPES